MSLFLSKITPWGEFSSQDATPGIETQALLDLPVTVTVITATLQVRH